MKIQMQCSINAYIYGVCYSTVGEMYGMYGNVQCEGISVY